MEAPKECNEVFEKALLTPLCLASRLAKLASPACPPSVVSHSCRRLVMASSTFKTPQWMGRWPRLGSTEGIVRLVAHNEDSESEVDFFFPREYVSPPAVSHLDRSVSLTYVNTATSSEASYLPATGSLPRWKADGPSLPPSKNQPKDLI